MFMLARAVTYASIFTGLVLVLLPFRLLVWTGISHHKSSGLSLLVGLLVAVAGAGLALWSVGAFAFLGNGTPAPFDPPRRLVVAGPYRYVRNPMYIGAGMAIAGAALTYRSIALAAYLCLLFLASHLFIVLYEEPTLKRCFGKEYTAYCHATRRWLPWLRIVRRDGAA